MDLVVPENEEGGWIGLTFAPGKKGAGSFAIWNRDLDADLARLVALGTTTLAPLIEDDEMVWYRIRELVERAEEVGLRVRRYPFHDGGIPVSLAEATAYVDELCNFYRRGERIVIHCAGGLGRAGTIGACVRIRLGLDGDADSAIAAIRERRSPKAVETVRQEHFIQKFAERVSHG